MIIHLTLEIVGRYVEHREELLEILRPILVWKSYILESEKLKSEEVHPLTTLERSYLQTFPKGFHFIGSKTDVEQMIGNAVPVKQAEYIARCISTYISEREDTLDPIQPKSVQLLLFRESR